MLAWTASESATPEPSRNHLPRLAPPLAHPEGNHIETLITCIPYLTLLINLETQKQQMTYQPDRFSYSIHELRDLMLQVGLEPSTIIDSQVQTAKNSSDQSPSAQPHESQATSSKVKMSGLLDLPHEILHNILGNCEGRDLAALNITCRELHKFVPGNWILWRKVYLNKFVCTPRSWTEEDDWWDIRMRLPYCQDLVEQNRIGRRICRSMCSWNRFWSLVMRIDLHRFREGTYHHRSVESFYCNRRYTFLSRFMSMHNVKS